mmetsp:Transcript_30309/g.59574  ORF Transcript_30309/g.59574 Transcript_30309/m.59574 type:complete len:98 (-) Transcript_30309:1110-1403(-)
MNGGIDPCKGKEEEGREGGMLLSFPLLEEGSLVRPPSAALVVGLRSSAFAGRAAYRLVGKTHLHTHTNKIFLPARACERNSMQIESSSLPFPCWLTF